MQFSQGYSTSIKYYHFTSKVSKILLQFQIEVQIAITRFKWPCSNQIFKKIKNSLQFYISHMHKLGSRFNMKSLQFSFLHSGKLGPYFVLLMNKIPYKCFSTSILAVHNRYPTRNNKDDVRNPIK